MSRKEIFSPISLFSPLFSCLCCIFFFQVLGYYIRNNIDTENLIKEIKSIASLPTEKYFFNVSEEAALSTIAGTLGNRIFNIEGEYHFFLLPYMILHVHQYTPSKRSSSRHVAPCLDELKIPREIKTKMCGFCFTYFALFLILDLLLCF